MRETPFLAILCISCTLWYRLFKSFNEIVSTVAANRNPYSQRQVQAEITRDIEMIGSGGKTPGKCLKICIHLWLGMPLPAVFKHFLETKTLLPTLEEPIFGCFSRISETTSLHICLTPPPPIFYYIFVRISRTNFLKSEDPPFPPWVRHCPLFFHGQVQFVHVSLDIILPSRSWSSSASFAVHHHRYDVFCLFSIICSMQVSKPSQPILPCLRCNDTL